MSVSGAAPITLPTDDIKLCVETAKADPSVPTGPIVDANLTFKTNAPSLSFQDYIGLNIQVSNSFLDRYDDFYVIAAQLAPDGKITETVCNEILTSNGQNTIIEHPVLAYAMAQQVTLTLYAEKDGVIYVGQSIVTSVNQVTLQMLDLYAKNAKICRMLVNMLNYGRAVQTAYSVFPNDLPTVGDYAAFGTTETELNAVSSAAGDGTMYINGPSISMQDKVEINVKFKTAEMVGRTVKVYADGEEYAGEILFQDSENGTKQIARIAVKATEMRKTYTIALYDDETGEAVTKVITTSIEAMCNLYINNLEPTNAYVILCKAIMSYGDAVYAFAYPNG